MTLEKKIEEAITSTLVVQNKQSIYRAVDKIKDLMQNQAREVSVCVMKNIAKEANVNVANIEKLLEKPMDEIHLPIFVLVHSSDEGDLSFCPVELSYHRTMAGAQTAMEWHKHRARIEYEKDIKNYPNGKIPFEQAMSWKIQEKKLYP